ncbi:MAG: ADP-forming succinate--CoA ligase subunit beta [Candidatus Marinimicrobia bacterium]|jgi:succinyl-CoA synthetase beta subunit|nr:ADP-forming succinate--CoA ligase subunit beta [Candidatus Neomarinimicrobiota bacterium]MDG1847018.1 ADP-forming succinate--CoA ligase subunit beta [Candidatus Neomarinimicrobiota bacterium]|tara:strand:- start:610 stop:1773 length:1164 start_codon:yes stop_codon:yes gene_type:complete
MKIHEYQGKQLFKKHQINIPIGIPAMSINEALEAYDKLDSDVVAIKAQIHAGGRGKGGGVKIAKNKLDAEKHIKNIFGMNLITHQTGDDGKIVERLYLESGVNIKDEFYAAITLDRTKEMDVFMVSSEGGIEIEKVAAESPEKIIKIWIDPLVGIKSFQIRKLAFGLGLSGNAFKEAVQIFYKMYECYQKNDASILEINPLVVTKDDKIIALDSKFNFDSNALFRQKEILDMRDLSEEDEMEIEASQYNLNYIKLDGNVGCMVNGAGLAMATMDIIKIAGGEPANFLDVGGTASAETVKNGFRIILSDKNVKSILINIFGGIVRCDRVARGVVQAVGELGLNVPVIVRLSGTNAEEAKEILSNSDVSVIPATGMKDAAEKAVKAINN